MPFIFISLRKHEIFFQELAKIIDETEKVCYNVIWTKAD